jgi:hypothetical protein
MMTPYAFFTRNFENVYELNSGLIITEIKEFSVFTFEMKVKYWPFPQFVDSFAPAALTPHKHFLLENPRTRYM